MTCYVTCHEHSRNHGSGPTLTPTAQQRRAFVLRMCFQNPAHIKKKKKTPKLSQRAAVSKTTSPPDQPTKRETKQINAGMSTAARTGGSQSHAHRRIQVPQHTCCLCCFCGCCRRGADTAFPPSSTGDATESMSNSPLRVRHRTPSRPPPLSSSSLRLVGVSPGSLQVCSGVGLLELSRRTTEPRLRLQMAICGWGGGGVRRD